MAIAVYWCAPPFARNDGHLPEAEGVAIPVRSGENLKTPMRNGFWSIVEDFVAHAAGHGTTVITNAGALAHHIRTHPDWDGAPVLPEIVAGLLETATSSNPRFPWTVDPLPHGKYMVHAEGVIDGGTA